jgi:hypothetical protein
VVTSSVVGIADDISAAGAGLVVDRTAVGFSSAVIELLRDAEARKRMGDAGRHLAASKYSPHAVAQSMIRLYEEVIEEHARKPISRVAKIPGPYSGPRSEGQCNLFREFGCTSG